MTFRDGIKSVQLLTLPSIDICLILPNLFRIVSAFVDKGSRLTDDRIVDLDLILEANAAYCFQDYTVPFGSKFVHIQSSFGVMLLGNIERMMSDMDKLPVNAEIESTSLQWIALDSAVSGAVV